MHRFLGALAGAALCTAVAVPAVAQDVAAVRTVRFGVQGGLALPTGDAGDLLDNGFTVGGTLDWRLVNRPFGLRLDVGYARFGLSDLFEELDLSGNISVLSGTGAVVVSIPTTGAVRPYLLGGAGMYHMRASLEFPSGFGDCDDFEAEARRTSATRASAARVAPSRRVSASGAAAGNRAARTTCTESETEAGLHAGGGLSFPLGGMDGYVELRYHSIFTEESNTTFVPLVFGLRF